MTGYSTRKFQLESKVFYKKTLNFHHQFIPLLVVCIAQLFPIRKTNALKLDCKTFKDLNSLNCASENICCQKTNKF